MRRSTRTTSRGRRAALAAVSGLAVVLTATACADGADSADRAGSADSAHSAQTAGAPASGTVTGLDTTTAMPMTPGPAARPSADESARTGAQPAPGGPGPGDRTASHSLTFIAMGDGGASGDPIGCGDSAVPVDFETSTIAPLGEVYRAQLAAEGPDYGQSGLTNTLAQSDLEYLSAEIDGGHARVQLTGSLRMGGECDIPRVRAQLTEPALQFPNVDTVTVLIDGVPLDQQLSLR